MPQKSFLFLGILGVLILGFLLGKFEPGSRAPIAIQEKEIRPEISLVQLKKLVGDSLELKISGPVRVLWGEENLVENDGEFQIPLGQIPNENDLRFMEFPYTANAKTGKFYPSDSYFARGVEVQHRRFFRTKEAASAAGFQPAKNVK